MYSGFGFPDCALTDTPHLLHLSAAPWDFLLFSLTSPLLLYRLCSTQHIERSRRSRDRSCWHSDKTLQGLPISVPRKSVFASVAWLPLPALNPGHYPLSLPIASLLLCLHHCLLKHTQHTPSARKSLPSDTDKSHYFTPLRLWSNITFAEMLPMPFPHEMPILYLNTLIS